MPGMIEALNNQTVLNGNRIAETGDATGFVITPRKRTVIRDAPLRIIKADRVIPIGFFTGSDPQMT
jgi:hypothetical protein